MIQNELLFEVVKLHAWGKQEKAIEIIEREIANIKDEALEFVLRIEAINMAIELGNRPLAQKHAKALSIIEPGLPLIAQVLSDNK